MKYNVGQKTHECLTAAYGEALKRFTEFSGTDVWNLAYMVGEEVANRLQSRATKGPFCRDETPFHQGVIIGMVEHLRSQAEDPFITPVYKKFERGLHDSNLGAGIMYYEIGSALYGEEVIQKGIDRKDRHALQAAGRSAGALMMTAIQRERRSKMYPTEYGEFVYSFIEGPVSGIRVRMERLSYRLRNGKRCGAMRALLNIRSFELTVGMHAYGWVTVWNNDDKMLIHEPIYRMLSEYEAAKMNKQDRNIFGNPLKKGDWTNRFQTLESILEHGKKYLADKYKGENIDLKILAAGQPYEEPLI